MADEYFDVNKYANEGGDTAPGTREQIKERNKAADALAKAVRKEVDALAETREKGSENIRKAEEAYSAAVPNPDVIGPAKQRSESK